MELESALRRVYAAVLDRVDGAALVAPVAAALPPADAVLAVGKASVAMLDGLVAAGRAPARGLLVAAPRALPPGYRPPPGIALAVGEHPEPGPGSLAAGRAALALAEAIDPDETLLVLLSGGASALCAAPAAGLTGAELAATTRALLDGGVEIGALNAVRKHLSAISGGRLAARCRGRVVGLVLSDVVGDDLATIASGPLSPDPSTHADALAAVGALLVPGAVRAHLAAGAEGRVAETPKPGDPCFSRVDLRLVGSPAQVPDLAAAAASGEGLAARVVDVGVQGEVEAVAAAWAARAARIGPGAAWVGGGEPTVTVRGDGIGGRCTHLALRVARAIAGRPDLAFLAAGTDDRDGRAEVAGAVVTGATWGEALARGLDPEAALARYDSATVLAALGCGVPGRARSNLLDVHLLAARRA